MNIVFDNIIFSKEKQGGISNYWYELIKNYNNEKDVFFIEEKNANDNIFRKKLNIKNIIPHNQLPLTVSRLLPVYYPKKTESLLYHSSFYRRLITRSRICEITTVHDFLHNIFSPVVKKLVHNKLKYDAIKRARGIICVSNNTLLDLKKYCSLKPEQKVTVIYNGVSKDYKPLIKNERLYKTVFSNFNLEDKFLLYVGARSNYKNFPFVLKLLDQLPDYKLVVVGNALTQSEKAIITKNLLFKIVMATGISNTDLNILYNYSHALLYPSSYEGFGIPVIEAMKAGCPVLALNTSSIPEVAGGAAILFDNLNISEYINKIKQLDNNDYRITIQHAGMENAKKFDWEKCYKQTSDFYAETFEKWQ